MKFINTAILLVSFVSMVSYSNSECNHVVDEECEPAYEYEDFLDDHYMPVAYNFHHTQESYSWDIDGDGVADALTDGLILMRYLFGMRGEALTEGVVSYEATRNYSEIEEYLETHMPY
jgi:hypothetical protein